MKEGGDSIPPRQQKNTWNQFLLMVSQIYRLDIIFHIQSCLPMCFSCSTNLLVNIPFSLPQQSSPAVLYPSSSCVVGRWDSNDTASGAFRQDLGNHAKMPHPGQSHNVVIYKHTYVKHDSWSGGCEFNLPSHTLWAAACVISLTTTDYISVIIIHQMSLLSICL